MVNAGAIVCTSLIKVKLWAAKSSKFKLQCLKKSHCESLSWCETVTTLPADYRADYRLWLWRDLPKRSVPQREEKWTAVSGTTSLRFHHASSSDLHQRPGRGGGSDPPRRKPKSTTCCCWRSLTPRLPWPSRVAGKPSRRAAGAPRSTLITATHIRRSPERRADPTSLNITVQMRIVPSEILKGILNLGVFHGQIHSIGS